MLRRLTHRTAARFAAVLALVLVFSGFSVSSAAAWQPDPGAHFNNPWGDRASRTKLVRTFIAAVEHAHKGSLIRVAAYSNDRKDIANALIRAHNRGVRIQMLLNDNWTSYQTKRIQKVLGSDIRKKSFLRICKSSCRGTRGNLHSKFYLFSHTGSRYYTTMMGSANLTNNGVAIQWNDMYTVNANRDLYSKYARMFDQMKYDKPRDHPYKTFTATGDYTLNFYPRYDTTASNDPIMARLNKVKCSGATGGTGIDGHTMIRISMYGWNGVRGRYLADKVAQLAKRRCNIYVIHSDGGGYVVSRLRDAGVHIRTASYDRNKNGTVDMYTHQKYMILSGAFGGYKPGYHVWTGSQNWSDIALNGDEVTMHIPRQGAFTDYWNNFKFIWRNHSHKVPAKPKS